MMKLLTVEEIESPNGYIVAWLKYQEEQTCYEAAVEIERLRATVKALAERLALVEKCPTCEQRAMGNNADMDKVNLYITGCCPNCNGTGRAHKDAMAALRSLGED